MAGKESAVRILRGPDRPIAGASATLADLPLDICNNFISGHQHESLSLFRLISIRQVGSHHRLDVESTSAAHIARGRPSADGYAPRATVP